MDPRTSGRRSPKLDPEGLPLVPQPTESPFDPLNYPNVSVANHVSLIYPFDPSKWLKYTILAEVSFLAFLATLNVVRLALPASFKS